MIRQKDNIEIPKEEELLTCTPVMRGRGSIKDTSPIMIARQIFQGEVRNIQNIGSKPFTPLVGSYSRDNVIIKTTLQKYTKKCSESVSKDSCNVDYENDMEEKAQVSLKDSAETSDKNYLILSKKDKASNLSNAKMIKLNSKSYKRLSIDKYK